MTNRNRRSAADRAEARRRSRYATQGREDEASAEDEGPPEEMPASRSGSFLGRLFPPAPQLPGKPDPLADFRYGGPLRGVVAALYLLARYPTPWIGMGALWAVGRLVMPLGGGIVGIVALLLSFGALIAAGWLGWPRPWLFGLMASIFGIVYYAGILAALFATVNIPEFPPDDAFVGAVYAEAAAFQPLFGAVAGWYGGYLRRRMAVPNAAQQERVRRRG